VAGDRRTLKGRSTRGTTGNLIEMRLTSATAVAASTNDEQATISAPPPRTQLPR
jgi:hypothetical protein